MEFEKIGLSDNPYPSEACEYKIIYGDEQDVERYMGRWECKYKYAYNTTNKYVGCVKYANRDTRNALWFECMLSAYYNRVVDLKFIGVEVYQSSGYLYQVFVFNFVS